MESLTVTYRSKILSISIDSSKLIPYLKEIISKQTNIKAINFELKFQNIIVAEHKFISDFTKDGSTFEMVNVSIDVVVVLNGANHPFCVKESKTIKEFLEDIYRSTGHDSEISLYCNGSQLADDDSLAANGVEQGCTLTAVNGKLRSMKRIMITYRDKTHQIDIDQGKTVLKLKRAVSEVTNIKADHFCLQLNNIYLCDHKEISMYMKDGSNFNMVNVIIKVYVALNGNEYEFYVKEASKVDDFKKDIAIKSRISDKMTLYYYSRVLAGTNTVLESGIRNRTFVIAVLDNTIISGIKDFTVIYRNDSHTIAMDTSNTVQKLKEKVFKVTEIEAKNFKLSLYWISLKDDKPLSEYVKYGTMLRMKNVIIDVHVRLDQKQFLLSVNEELSVDEFKKEIILKSGIDRVSILSYQGDILVGDKSLRQCEVEHGCTILALTTVTGG